MPLHLPTLWGSIFFLSYARILEYLGFVVIYFGFLEMTGRGRGQGPGSGCGKTEARGIEAGSIIVGASQIHKLQRLGSSTRSELRSIVLMMICRMLVESWEIMVQGLGVVEQGVVVGLNRSKCKPSSIAATIWITHLG